MTVNWDRISPEQFEELCYHLLESMGFADLKWHGEKGSDRGRDLTANRVIELVKGTNQITAWVVQCKRYTKRPPTKQQIYDAMLSAREHEPTHFLLIASINFTSATHDWINSENKRQPFAIEVWEAPRLERLIRETYRC